MLVIDILRLGANPNTDLKGDYMIAFLQGNKVLITSKDNYNSQIMDLNKCCTFDGTLEQAQDYIAKYFN